VFRRLLWKLWPLIGGPRFDGAWLHYENPDQLLAALNCRWDEDIRLAAVRRLLHNREDWAVQPLVRSLKDSSRHVRGYAARALRNRANPLAVGALIELLAQEPDTWVCEEAAAALGEIGDPRANEPLLGALYDPRVSVRAKAAAALKSFPSPRTFDALVDALRDPHGWVRREAIGALTACHDPRVLETLLQALKDSDAVRAAAARALIPLHEPRVIPALVECLSRPSFELRRTALEALESLGWQPENDEQRLAAAVARCDWEEVEEFGAAAAAPLANVLAGRDWENTEVYDADEARQLLERILTANAAEIDTVTLESLSGLHFVIQDPQETGLDGKYMVTEYVDLGDGQLICELASEELQRRGLGPAEEEEEPPL
jgi:HEAT repeat protein